ncbi:hypothetical protein ANANG_G00206320 [Anguilla anguilla]|uniref:Uncharacterized protein n=1 Tax=Anguilla anguilla TaxID=7936 RepID=A0A9D3LYX9_ANGAN|nr:hypothetical protein ANANG_G00206320 [Anguilla anguilla]
MTGDVLRRACFALAHPPMLPLCFLAGGADAGRLPGLRRTFPGENSHRRAAVFAGGEGGHELELGRRSAESGPVATMSLLSHFC